MFFSQFALRINHFRLNPYTELHACLIGFLYQIRHTIGQFVLSRFPVAKTCIVILARIFVAKPSVIKQEHIYAEVFGFTEKFGQFLFIKVKIGILPVVEEGHTVFISLVKLVIECPSLKITATLSGTILTQGEDKVWGTEYLTFLQ